MGYGREIGREGREGGREGPEFPTAANLHNALIQGCVTTLEEEVCAETSATVNISFAPARLWCFAADMRNSSCCVSVLFLCVVDAASRAALERPNNECSVAVKAERHFRGLSAFAKLEKRTNRIIVGKEKGSGAWWRRQMGQRSHKEEVLKGPRIRRPGNQKAKILPLSAALERHRRGPVSWGKQLPKR
eukprot:RCo021414